MNDTNPNPHEQAVAELERWEEQGIRHCFDPSIVVMADFTRKEIEECKN